MEDRISIGSDLLGMVERKVLVLSADTQSVFQENMGQGHILRVRRK